jgi:hypothetical protein
VLGVISIIFPENLRVMLGNNGIPNKSAENNSSPLENDVFDIPGNIVLDIIDIVRDLDIA